MPTQRPVGPVGKPVGKPVGNASGKPLDKPVGPPAGRRTPAKESTEVRDLGAQTLWHTRGLQSNSRLRMPLQQRTPPRQLPPSRVPRLLLWLVMLGLAAILANAVMQMLR